jgi:dipeptidyl aminopeptidase/acylaminoacyl peptidase
MGGGPYPSTSLRNYESFSAAMTARRVKAPVLIEADSLEAITNMEYYSALRENGVPVDFYVYPNDGHVFLKPEHLMTSMRRNLDWFEYWLTNRVNSSAESASQYARWRGFGARLNEMKPRSSRYGSN